MLCGIHKTLLIKYASLTMQQHSGSIGIGASNASSERNINQAYEHEHIFRIARGRRSVEKNSGRRDSVEANAATGLRNRNSYRPTVANFPLPPITRFPLFRPARLYPIASARGDIRRDRTRLPRRRTHSAGDEVGSSFDGLLIGCRANAPWISMAISAISGEKSGKTDNTAISVKADRVSPLRDDALVVPRRRSFVQTARAGMETAIRLSQLVLVFSKVNIHNKGLNRVPR